MPAVQSTLLPLGTRAPVFTLPAANPGAADGLVSSSSLFEGARGVVVVFTCNHCPYAIHIEDRLIRLATAWAERGVRTVAISSNDADAYPADSFEAMTERAAAKAYPFPYLYDASQHVAQAFHAACTPDLYLFDADRRLVYRGRLDDGRPGSAPTTSDLDDAVQALLDGRPVAEPQIPSVGCSIKWRSAG